MKKWIAVMLAGVMTAAMVAGCGGKDAAQTEAPAETDKEWKPVRVPDTVDLAPASIPNPALFMP